MARGRTKANNARPAKAAVKADGSGTPAPFAAIWKLLRSSNSTSMNCLELVKAAMFIRTV